MNIVKTDTFDLFFNIFSTMRLKQQYSYDQSLQKSDSYLQNSVVSSIKPLGAYVGQLPPESSSSLSLTIIPKALETCITRRKSR